MKKNAVRITLDGSDYMPATNPNQLPPQPATGHLQNSPQYNNNTVYTGTVDSGHNYNAQQGYGQRPQPQPPQGYAQPPQNLQNSQYGYNHPPQQAPYGYNRPTGSRTSLNSSNHSSRRPSGTYNKPLPGFRPLEESRMPPNAYFDEMRAQRPAHRHHRQQSIPQESDYSSSSDDELTSSIYGRNNTLVHGHGDNRSHASHGNVFYEDSLNANVSTDVIQELAGIEDGSISVHNPRLLAIFRQFDYETIGWGDLVAMLIDPGTGRNFKENTCKTLVKVFGSSQSYTQLDFRAFTVLCGFLKGCMQSFSYYDRDGSHTLESAEFVNALQINQLRCPRRLLEKIFQFNNYVTIEGFIMAVILIRKHEHS